MACDQQLGKENRMCRAPSFPYLPLPTLDSSSDCVCGDTPGTPDPLQNQMGNFIRDVSTSPPHTHTHTCAHTHSLLRDESRSAFRLLPTPYPAVLPFLSPQPHQGRSILLSLCSDQENALFHLNSSKSSSAIESYVQH